MNFVLVIVYRPGSKAATSVLFDDFANLVERLTVYTAPVVVVCDINLYLEDQFSATTVKFPDFLDGADLVQHAVGPTDRAGHTLDVVISQRTTRDTVHVDPPIISANSLITAKLYVGACAEPRTKDTTRSKRLWNELDVDAFRRDSDVQAEHGPPSPPTGDVSSACTIVRSVLSWINSFPLRTL